MRRHAAWLVLGLVAACDDPALEPFSGALERYDAGREALDGGRPADAVTAFADARTRDPRSLALRLWEAKALADAGRLEEADLRLGEILAEEPSVAVAWYNRAAYRARAGRMEAAASDLSRALALGARSALEAADDPDFAVARAHPAFGGILPAQPLEASARGADTLFIGSRYPLELVVSALPTAELGITRQGADPGCLRLDRVVQDDTVASGRTTRRFTADFRAEGPCHTTLGPFEVTAGAARTTLDPVPVVVEAPPGAPPATGLPALPSALPVPSAAAPPDAGFAAKRLADGVVAMGRPDRAITGGGRPPDVALEWRVDGQTRARGGWWRDAGPIALSAEGWDERL